MSESPENGAAASSGAPSSAAPTEAPLAPRPAVDINVLLNTRVKIKTDSYAEKGQFAPLLDFTGVSLMKLAAIDISASRKGEVNFTYKWALLDQDLLGFPMIWDVPSTVSGVIPAIAGARGKWAKERPALDRYWELMGELGMKADQIKAYNDADMSYKDLIDLALKQGEANPRYYEFDTQEFNDFWSTKRVVLVEKARYDALVKLGMHRKPIDPAIKRRSSGGSKDGLSRGAPPPPPPPMAGPMGLANQGTGAPSALPANLSSMMASLGVRMP